MKLILMALIILTAAPIESSYIMASPEPENIVVIESGVIWILQGDIFND
jgi:hypothetical protein